MFNDAGEPFNDEDTVVHTFVRAGDLGTTGPTGDTGDCCHGPTGMDFVSLSDSSTTQNINAGTSNVITWNAVLKSDGTAIARDGTETSKIVFHEDMYAMISCGVFYNTAGVRYNGVLRTVLNSGSNLGPGGAGGYVRNASDNNQGSLEVTAFIYEFSSGDFLEAVVTRESSITTAAYMERYGCFFTALKIKSL